MKTFKSLREGNSVEPGVSEINDVPEDPLSFVEIRTKKTKVVKEDLQEAVTVKKNNYSWGTMMTVHHGANTSYPLHPEHQAAIKKLKPGEKTSFRDETNSIVHAHREDNTVHLSGHRSGGKSTSLPYHHFDTSEHAKPADKKPADEYDRKVTAHLKKKYNEETVVETKGAPKGFHFTKDGKLKRGDANQDGDGGPMLRADPLDKQRNKIPAVSEESELGDLAHETTMKHRFLVTYSDPNHTMVSKRKEKLQKHILVPGTHKGETVYQGDAEPLAKKYMKKQGFKVHEVEHVGMVKKRVYESIDDMLNDFSQQGTE
jgi:hypothetical protein